MMTSRSLRLHFTDCPRRPSSARVVYIAADSANEVIKIGSTGNLKTKLTVLRGQSIRLFGGPKEFRLLAVQSGGHDVERGLMERFRKHRVPVGKEWFAYAPEILKYAASIGMRAAESPEAATDARSIVRAAASRGNLSSDGVTARPYEVATLFNPALPYPPVFHPAAITERRVPIVITQAEMRNFPSVEEIERETREPEPEMIRERGPVKMMVDDFGGPLDGRKCGCRGQQVCDVCQSVFRETVLVPLEEM